MSNQKTILITGAGSGLGRGLAIALSRAGHVVIATDLDEAAAKETLAQLEHPDSAIAVPLDVTRDDQVRALFEKTIHRPVDVLVNNAGLQHVAPLEEFGQDKWDQLLNVMLRGACVMTRAVLPGMRTQGYGRVVNIGSIHSLVASPFKSAYVAAKHGLLGLAKVVALETADVDVTINTICPSYIRTPLVDAQIANQAKVR